MSKKPDFLYVDTGFMTWKLELIEKYWVAWGQKWVWPLCS